MFQIVKNSIRYQIYKNIYLSPFKVPLDLTADCDDKVLW